LASLKERRNREELLASLKERRNREELYLERPKETRHTKEM
jgi:hypothetical protein